MQPRFEQFIRERQFLMSVSDGTIEWYRRALKWMPSESPTQADLKAVVVRMREKGLKETGVNAILWAINSYLHWASGSERRCGAGCTHPRMQPLREPHLVLPTFSEVQVKRLIAWKANSLLDALGDGLRSMKTSIEASLLHRLAMHRRSIDNRSDRRDR